MRYESLSKSDRDIIVRAYGECVTKDKSREEVQENLAKYFNVTTRTIRKWAKKMEVGVLPKNKVNPSKILIYDIETSRVRAWIWWTGKQYISHDQLIDEPKIITVSWKWLGSETVEHLTWDKNHSDEELMRKFIEVYNQADMVIGYNNDRFDNRWINARAMKYDLPINTYVRSYDIMKEEKRVFRTPSYSMSYMAKFSNVTHKQGHEGITMWNKIQTGTPEEQEEYLAKMVEYNVGDIVSTEELYIRLRKYFGHKMHLGVLYGGEKFSCPDTGSTNVELFKRTVTPAGTVQIIMRNKDTDVKYKITNKQYMSFLDYKLKQIEKE